MSKFNKMILVVFILELIFCKQAFCTDSTKVFIKKKLYGDHLVLLKKGKFVIDSISVRWAKGFENVKPIVYNNAVFYIAATYSTSGSIISFCKCPFSEDGFLKDRQESCLFVNRREFGELNISKIKLNSNRIKIYYYEGYKQCLRLDDTFFSKLCLILPKHGIQNTQ